MTAAESVTAGRLASQLLERRAAREPAEVVAHLCGVQAQDARRAPWALGVRAPGLTLGDVDAALRDGSVVRTWLFRGTLHYVSAKDLAWLRTLLAPRVAARAAKRHEALELDQATFDRSRDVLQAALEGQGAVERAELARRLEEHGICAAGQRLPYLLQRAAFDGVLVCGPSQAPGADYRPAPPAPPTAVPASEALARLARRYLEGHGPASVHDLAWWAGLSVHEARRALLDGGAAEARFGDRSLWTAASVRSSPPGRDARLLPPFDEYLVGYRDRAPALQPEHVHRINAGGGLLAPTVIVGGAVVGTWRYDAATGNAAVEPLRAWTADERAAIDTAAGEVAAFHATPGVARRA